MAEVCNTVFWLMFILWSLLTNKFTLQFTGDAIRPSTPFLPHDATHRAGYAVARCPSSVYPYVTRQYSVEITRYHQTSSPSCSHTVLIFPYQTLSQYMYSDGNIPNRGVEYTGSGVWRHRDFRPISRFISEMIQDTAIITMECELETVRKLSNGTIFNDLQWPLTQM